MNKIYIALDGGKKLSLGSLQSFEQKDFKLRSVDINQFQAKVSVGLADGDRNFILHSTLVQNLKPSENGYSYLNCQLKKEGKKLILVINNKGRNVCREIFSLVSPEKIKRRIFILSGLGLLLAILILVLVFGNFSFLSFSSHSTKPVTHSSVVDKSNITAKSEPVKSVPVKESISEEVSREPVLEKSDSPEKGIPAGEINSVPQLSLPERRIYFAPNNTQIDKDSEKVLRNILTILLENPGLRVTITGHCAIAGTEAGRREISVQRAENTFSWLKKQGWVPENPPKITGEAGNFPLTLDPDNQDINRRVEIDYSN